MDQYGGATNNRKMFFEHNTYEEWAYRIEQIMRTGQWPDYLEYDDENISDKLNALGTYSATRATQNNPALNHIDKAKRASNTHLNRMFKPPYNSLHIKVTQWLPRLGWKPLGSRQWEKE